MRKKRIFKIFERTTLRNSKNNNSLVKTTTITTTMLISVTISAILINLISIVQLQELTSPCPNVFQYQMDTNRNLYGLINVISSNDNILQLNVELSVGNPVDSFNGEITLLTPKFRVVDDLNEGRPIRYRLIFPKWQQIPPQITKIFLNGRLLCSGPKLSPSPWISVLTTISLQHRLTLKISPLNSDNDDNGDGGGGLNRRKPTTPTYPRPVKNPFLTNDEILPDNFNINFNPQTTKQPPKKDDNNFVNNPFLNSWLSNTNTDINNVVNNNILNNTPSTSTTVKPIDLTSFLPNVPKNPFTDDNQNTPNIQAVSNTTNQPYADICGLPVVSNPLIVKGHSVPRGAFPWLAAMFHVKDTGPEYKCSGTLITNRHILTAAHCVKDDVRKIRPSDILFVLGKLNIKRWTMLDGERNVEAERIFVHQDYRPRTSDADIAIVQLNDDITFNSLIRPICLWLEMDDLNSIVGQNGKVVGWGKDEDGYIKTEEPKQATIPIVSQETCLRSSEAFKYITSNRTFCAGRRDGSGPCNGDSGSGFIIKRNERWILRGVVSVSTYDSSRQTCDLNNYVVFTDVTKHKDWLLSIISSNK